MNIAQGAFENRAYRIRRAIVADAAAVSLVASATFLETFASLIDGDAIVEHCRTKLTHNAFARDISETRTTWLAEYRKTAAPVGFAQVTRAALPGAKPRDLELKRIYILSAYQGSGLAHLLWREVQLAAQRARAERIMLAVYKHNERALIFYEKIGFRHVCDDMFEMGGERYPGTVLALEL